MELGYERHELKTLTKQLITDFPAITELYVFGSRRFRTGSRRSDLDILVCHSGTIHSADLRGFSTVHCTALDLFDVKGSAAISCANGSRVEAQNFESLVYQLGAILYWSNSIGFLDVDIDWEFEILAEPDMKSTVLVSRYPQLPINIQNKNSASEGGLWARIKEHPLSIIVAAIVASAGITFEVIRQVQIVPMDQHIKNLEKQIESFGAKPQPLGLIAADGLEKQALVDTTNSGGSLQEGEGFLEDYSK
ncbi:MAG: hypothetical protein H8E14_14915 [Candidatus Marinimicrobia bacterium]|nr:hypothetical protein [Candidatus Neomarinimicrobiota bacterium]